MFLPPTQQPTPSAMSIESMPTPDIRLDLANDQPLVWDGLNMPSSSQPASMVPSQPSEPIERNPFYSYPESCGSPSSSGTTFSRASHASSVSSTPAAVLEPYHEDILDCGLTSSPMPMHAELPAWHMSGADLPASDMAPLSIDPVSALEL